MNVLVAYASKHGATEEIARAIANELATAGLRVELAPVAEAGDVDDYDAVVAGSAVYVGRWLPEAVTFVDENRALLADKPVWLFSSGPIGTPEPKPAGDPEGLAEVAAKVEPRAHRTFAGKLDRAKLSLGEKLITNVVRAPAGDYRDWAAVTEYAREIAQALGLTTAAGPRRTG